MSRPARALLVGTLVVGSAAAACTRICAEGIEEDGRYRVTILEPWREGGTYGFDRRYIDAGAISCGGLRDLTADATLELTGTGEVAAGECNNVVARVEKAPPTVSLGVHRGGGEGFIAATHEATIGGCKGGWQLAFRHVTPASVFAEPKAGDLPPVIVTRFFQPAAESAACKRCSDRFVVKLQKR